MKKNSVLVLTILLLSLAGCGQAKDNVDVGKWAVIKLPNENIVEGEIQSLTRWNYSFVEVIIDGITYCIHPSDFACYEKEAQP